MATRPSHARLFNKLYNKKQELQPRVDDLDLKADIIASMRFPKQHELANDPSRFIGVTCGRRSGKSTGVLTIAGERCLRKKNSSWCIVGLTRPSIKRIYWRVLKKLDNDLGLGLKFNETELYAEFPNGSLLQFLGAENASEVEKIRGNAYDGVIIDECKSFNLLVFAELIEDVIRPCLMDRAGVLILIGTPGRVLGGDFYNATHFPSPTVKDSDGVEWPINVRYGSPNWGPAMGKASSKTQWSSHHWDARDNEAMPNIWLEALEYKASKRWADDNPTWCREYLGLWVADNAHRVFRYDPLNNDFTHEFDGTFGLPPDHDWNLVLGFDPGFDDPTAFVIVAYSTTHPVLYNLHSESHSGLNVTMIAKMIKELEKDWGTFEIMVGDRAGLGKMIFAELSEAHGIHIERTEKKEKEDLIELVNDDLDAGRVKIERGSKLAVEMASHKWNMKGQGNGIKRVESNETPNDTCDAFVYAFRWCEHRRFRAKPVKVDHRSEAWFAELERKEIEAAEKKYKDLNVGTSDWQYEPWTG